MEIDLIDKICDYLKVEMYRRDHHWFKSFRFSFSTNGISPVVEKEYTYSDLGFDGEVADFTSYGEEDAGSWNVVFLINQKLSCKAVNVMVSKDNLVVTDEATNFDKNGGDGKADKFVSISPCKSTLIATIQSNDRQRMERWISRNSSMILITKRQLIV